MKSLQKTLSVIALTTAALTSSFSSVAASEAPHEVVVGFSHYTGWEPYAYIRDNGILDQVNKEFNTDIKIRFYGSYDASLSDYAGGSLQGVTMTNMDGLVAASAVKTDALILGDTSHGNDAVLAYGYSQCSDLKGQDVYLLTKSVSHYMLQKYLATCGLTDLDVTLKNNSDESTLVAMFNNAVNTNTPIAMVTWNPNVQSIMENPKAVKLFDSSQIKGEISDWLMVNADESKVTANDKAALKKMWAMAMKDMTTRGQTQDEMIAFMAKFAETSVPSFKGQMKTTRFFVTEESAQKELMSANQESIMEDVIAFVDEQEIVKDMDIEDLGVRLADGTVLGDEANIVLDFQQ